MDGSTRMRNGWRAAIVEQVRHAWRCTDENGLPAGRASSPHNVSRRSPSGRTEVRSAWTTVLAKPLPPRSYPVPSIGRSGRRPCSLWPGRIRGVLRSSLGPGVYCHRRDPSGIVTDETPPPGDTFTNRHQRNTAPGDTFTNRHQRNTAPRETFTNRHQRNARCGSAGLGWPGDDRPIRHRRFPTSFETWAATTISSVTIHERCRGTGGHHEFRHRRSTKDPGHHLDTAT